MSALDPIGLLVGLREEASPIRRMLREARAGSIDGFRIARGSMSGRPVLLVHSGAGRERAARATAALLDTAPVHAIFAVGFAGALTPGIEPGALCTADRVLALPDPRSPRIARCFATESPPADLPASRVSIRLTLVTTDQVIGHADEKRRLAYRMKEEWEIDGPLIVDMESAGVAEMAASRGVPFMAIRVVTDSATRDLPMDFARCVGSNGEFSNAALVGQLLKRPAALPGLVRLGRDSLSGARRLATYIEELLACWP